MSVNPPATESLPRRVPGTMMAVVLAQTSWNGFAIRNGQAAPEAQATPEDEAEVQKPEFIDGPFWSPAYSGDPCTAICPRARGEFVAPSDEYEDPPVGLNDAEREELKDLLRAGAADRLVPRTEQRLADLIARQVMANEDAVFDQPDG